MSTVEGVSGLEITGPRQERYDEVLTPRALELIALLHRELNPRRLELLEARRERVQGLADGGTRGFAAAAVGMAGREGELFRKVFGWSLLLLLIMCIIVVLQATPVLGWMVPAP